MLRPIKKNSFKKYNDLKDNRKKTERVTEMHKDDMTLSASP